MAFRFKPHIRVTGCGKDVVVLDLQADKFHILPNTDAATINTAMHGMNQDLAASLLEYGFIQGASAPETVPSTIPDGFFEQRWMLPLAQQVPSTREKLSAFREVALTNVTLRRARLQDVLNNVSTVSIAPIDDLHQTNTSIKVDRLMAALNLAFSVDLTGNKCLAYSYNLVRLARHYGIPARLVIGVRTNPFFSHAWAELHETVMNDDPHLRSKLAPIASA